MLNKDKGTKLFSAFYFYSDYNHNHMQENDYIFLKI